MKNNKRDYPTKINQH